MNSPSGPPDLPPAAEKTTSGSTVPIGTPGTFHHAVSAPIASAKSSAPFPPVPRQMIDEYDLGMQPRRRFLPLILFLLSCFFTYAAGTYHWQPTLFGLQTDPAHGEHWDLRGTWAQMQRSWQDGLIYMGCVMSVLLAHEMGHFLMTVRYRVPASYPIFLPVPIMLTGTMGAVIGMQGFRANRRQMFDIGLAGPLAGLVVTVPLVWFGIKIGQHATPQHGSLIFGDPLLAKWLIHWLRPDMAPGEELVMNPVYMAGWVGMFVTGLNMLPISQLDGGHVIYALFLKNSRVIARAFLLAAISYIIIYRQLTWVLMVVIITLIGVDHPRTADDTVPLGPVRTILGLASLALPVLCFTPYRLLSG